MKLIIEIADDEIRRLVAVLGPQPPYSPPRSAPQRLLTIKEVADELRISRSKAYDMIDRGEIQALRVGSRKRVSTAALAEFVARPVLPPVELSFGSGSRATRTAKADVVAYAKAAIPHPGPRQSKRATNQIDLSVRPTASKPSGPQVTDQEWDAYCGKLSERGLPGDVVDQIRADRAHGLNRVHVLTVAEAAQYLGISAGGVAELIKSGKLRLITIAPPFSDEKPSKRIPAKDVLALTEGS